jgi:hypothetical protein
MLIASSYHAYAVEFYRCVDDKGQINYTNIKNNALGNACSKTPDIYAFQLNQDYQNLEQLFNPYTDEVEYIEENNEGQQEILAIPDQINTKKLSNTADKTLKAQDN